MTLGTKKLVGHVDVDAGLIWVGDPCYIMGSDASDKVENWSEFCDKLFDHPSYDSGATPVLGGGVGLAIQSGYGDGTYPVYVQYEDNRPMRVIIEFDGDDED